MRRKKAPAKRSAVLQSKPVRKNITRLKAEDKMIWGKQQFQQETAKIDKYKKQLNTLLTELRTIEHGRKRQKKR